MSERTLPPSVWAAPPAGRVLVFAPHADDEVIGVGGTLALHRAQGDPVRVVVMTAGTGGDPDGVFGTEIAAIRRREALEGGAILGLTDYAFWEYPDGFEMSGEDEKSAAARGVKELRGFSPDLVYAPWEREAHLDHWNAWRVAARALREAGFGGRSLGFEVWTPCVAEVVVDVTPVWSKKVEALCKHASQLRYTDHVAKTLGMNAHRSLYLPAGSRYGEALVRLLPERKP
ncbi:MAG TPA: PIG-L deacetylase family protein [Planctomycetota bacterium]|nr:PIG-L deacetylase family protein [Planctomycetota bacterium]